jgi:alpha-acetolactate decarboxylase
LKEVSQPFAMIINFRKSNKIKTTNATTDAENVALLTECSQSTSEMNQHSVLCAICMC